MNPSRVPIATYRIQFNKDFRFADCVQIVPYLHQLGVSEVYASPRFRARRGSSHGYDVANPLRVNSELGTDDEFDDLCAKLKKYEMGLLLDIVPNHMAASHENPWWTDVLENGPSSPYAHYFAIDWHPAITKAAFLQESKVLLAVLGDLYGNVLESQEIALYLDEGGFSLRYYERQWPIDPATYGPILEHCARKLAEAFGDEHPAVLELRELRVTADNLPARTVTDTDEIQRRLESAEPIKRRIFRMYRDQVDVRLRMDAALREICGTKGNPASFDALHRLLDAQGYRLAFWKIAFEEINYRRFFDINDLVSLRVELPDVFLSKHMVILQLVRDGKVSGLRVDHIDGLCDPAEYLARLHAAVKDVAPEHNLYIVVEKILARDEPLPEQWPVCGTTGYDFLNAVNDIFLEPQGIKSLEAAYARFTGDADSFDEICYKRNKQVMEQLFAGEVNALGHHLGRLAARDWQARDVPLSELVRALVETTACLALYRTYIRCSEISERDRFYLDEALEAARRRTQETEIGTPAFQFLRSVLFLEPPFYAPEQKHEYLSFVMHWQQFTGPVMAKGLEDTASYVYNALISRNEVGGDPLRRRPPLNLDEFHQFNHLRLSRWPFTLNATSTHDTKRSEDVRARLNVLSEIAPQWEQSLERWRTWNGARKVIVDSIATPAPSEEVLIYQTLLGSWPLDSEEAADYGERIAQFALKAMREAKTYSRWTLPNEEHESAVIRFIEAILTPSDDNLFLNDFLSFMERIARHGALNSLSQVLIKITAPGIPDIYQGMELWNLSLVDPDNRRPVNFQKRIDMLAELRKCETEQLSLLLKEMVREWKDGRIKLYLSDKALDFRREHAPVFLQGEYVPLAATGLKAANICAFARQHEGFWCLTAAPRWTTQLVEDGALLPNGSPWEDTALQLPPGAPERWRNVFTGEEVNASDSAEGTPALALRNVLDQFPVALLSSI